MNIRILPVLRFALGAALFPTISLVAQSGNDSGPYKLLTTAKVGGAGNFDYVSADSDNRRLYIPRGNRVTVFDLDSLKAVGEIPGTQSVHGVAVDSKAGHGFSSSKPVVMWDAKTLEIIKSIEVTGNPDGIFSDNAMERIYVFSHRSPNVTVIDGKAGLIIGTLDLEGAPEQAAVDLDGHLFIDLEDKDKVAVVDTRSLKVTGTFELGGKGGMPAGLAIDAKNHILFVCCRNPATCVVMSTVDGKIISTLPIGAGTDGAVFNPTTMEAFSSQRDGTTTVIAEKSPTDFAVEQTIQTKSGAKTCTLDSKSNKLFLITADYEPAPAATRAPASQESARPARANRGPMVPDSFSILVVGK